MVWELEASWAEARPARLGISDPHSHPQSFSYGVQGTPKPILLAEGSLWGWHCQCATCLWSLGPLARKRAWVCPVKGYTQSAVSSPTRLGAPPIPLSHPLQSLAVTIVPAEMGQGMTSECCQLQARVGKGHWDTQRGRGHARVTQQHLAFRGARPGCAYLPRAWTCPPLRHGACVSWCGQGCSCVESGLQTTPRGGRGITLCH